MKITLTMHVNSQYVGHQEYEIREKLIFKPAQSVLENFTFACEDYFAKLPNSGLTPVEVIKFLDRDKTYNSKSSLRNSSEYYQATNKRLRTDNLLLQKQITSLEKEYNRKLARYKRTDKLYKKILKKKYRPKVWSDSKVYSTPEEMKYYRVFARTFVGNMPIGVSYGYSMLDATDRFGRIRGDIQYPITLNQIRNPRLK